MSALDLALRNLAAWSVQVDVLALVLGLPLLQPWHATAPAVTWSVAPSSALPGPDAAASGGLPSATPAGWPFAAAGLLGLGVAFGFARIGAGLAHLRSLRRRARTFAHVGLTAAALVLAVSWAASAVPLQSAKPAAPTATIAVEDSVTAPGEPKLVHQVHPAYPPDAKQENVQGLFQIDVVIGKDGAIKVARVVASAPTKERLEAPESKKGTPAAQEGDARLAAAALDAVKQWRYAPILKDGKPVEFKATVTVNFNIA